MATNTNLPVADRVTEGVNRLLGVIGLLPIYAVVMYTFWLAAYEKFFDRHRTIPHYESMFASSIIGRLGATNALITFMGVLEFAAVGILAVSLARREFLAGRQAPLLKLGLWLSATIFAMLGFGLRLIGNHAGTANQYYYLGVTVGFLAFVYFWENRHRAS
jgi:hypothetical protein